MTLQGVCGGITEVACESIGIQDEGILLGSVNTLNFTGAGVTASVAGDIATININGGAGGSVSGPGSSTDNAVALWDGVAGDTLQNSVVIIDPITGNTSGIGTLAAGTTTITSSSASALSVGPNGTTNPALQVDASTASLADGVLITGGVASGGPVISSISSGATSPITIKSLGSSNTILDTSASGGNIRLRNSGNERLTVSQSRLEFTVGTSGTASTVRFSFIGAADTGMTAATESPSVYFNLSQTRQWASNTTVALQRAIRVSQPTYAFASSGGVITDASTFYIDGAPIAGTNATLTNAWALYVAGGNSVLGTVKNTRIAKRVVITTQSATPTINTDNTDISQITGLAQAITSMTTNLSGTPLVGDMLMIQITDNGTARGITWGASFAATTVALPTTTVISTMLRVLFQRNNANTIWDCIATA